MATTADLVANYTARFSARYLHDHSVGSGLGLWLLLALLAPAAEGEDRRRLEAELGTDADDAAQRATKLLAGDHPAVHAAIALWDRPELVSSELDSWSASLPDGVDRGPMPDQAHADAWAHRHTLGMIRTFPMQIRADTAVLLASALATDVTWNDPFVAVEAEQLGGSFGKSITLGLRAPNGHTQLLADTDAAGTVAVHAAASTTALQVISVIGPPDVSITQMHLAATQVARLLTGDDRDARRVDLFELELVPGHAWTLTEDRAETDQLGPIQHVRTTLAAWTATSSHVLSDDPGIAETGALWARFVHDPRGATAVAARQSAVAEYSREGFRAAAITSIAAGASARTRWKKQRRRVAEVRFNRPYAVLAIALGPRDRVSSWSNVPVFSAWVGKVVDTPKPADQGKQAAERRARDDVELSRRLGLSGPTR